ncbi:hypothetical protein CJ178_32325 [Rhodococcus sp. ACPA4]|nr:hypothetical protein CJ178_32325 [Rhodococcus sp. ACPA4]
MESSEGTALEDIDYFDSEWAYDVPNSPNTRKRSAIEYLRVVAVQDGAYVGFLAGNLLKTDALVAVAAALNPGQGIGPKLLDAFSVLATAAGRTRLRLMPDTGAGHENRVRFFKEKCGMDWCADKPTYMCKPIVAIEIDATLS